MKKMFTVGMTRWCYICQRKTTFYLGGVQSLPSGNFKLWNCHECNGTQSDQLHTGNTGVLTECGK